LLNAGCETLRRFDVLLRLPLSTTSTKRSNCF
jgi:hypothetical protein